MGILETILENNESETRYISSSSDFPYPSEVYIGWQATVLEDVTDNDPTRTETGQSFSAGDIITWNGTDWTVNTNGVSQFSFNNANGFFGSVANPNTTPELTLSTTITGVLLGNGTSISGLGYGSSNTPSTLVYRDSSSNFSGNVITASKFSSYLSSGTAYLMELYGAVGTNPSAIIGNTENYLRLGVNSSNEVNIEFLPYYSSIWTRAPVIQGYVTGGNVSNLYLSGDNLLLSGITTEVTEAFKLSALTASTVPYLDADKLLKSSSVTPTELGYLSGVTSNIQTQLNAKQSTSLTSGNILVGNVSNVATDVAMSGDVTIDSSGITAIGALKVTNAMLAGSIANAKLSNSSVTIGSTNVSLGATSLTLAGLTSVTATTFTGALTGNASTATTLQTARTIGAVSFNGSANIVPQTIQTVDDTSDTTCFILFGNSSGSVTGGQQPKTNAGLRYNASTNALSIVTSSASQITPLTINNSSSGGVAFSIISASGSASISLAAPASSPLTFALGGSAAGYRFSGLSTGIGHFDSSGNLTSSIVIGSEINYNTTNLKVTSTALNTIQDIAPTSTPTFAALTINGVITSQITSASQGSIKLLNNNNTAGDRWWIGWGHGTSTADSNDRARIGVDIKSGGNGQLVFQTGAAGSLLNSMFIDDTGRVGILNTAPTAVLDVAGSTQLLPKIVLSGQEFYQAGNTSTSGFALLLNVNRTGNRQLCFADSAALTQNSTNSTIRFYLGGTNTPSIDSIATDGNTAKTLNIQSTGAATVMGGNVGFAGQASWDAFTAFQGPNNSAKAAKCYAWNTYSDLRQKRDWKTLAGKECVDIINQSNFVEYFWKDEFGDGGKNPHIGLLAQEFAKVRPELCTYDQEGIANGIDSGKFAYICGAAIKYLTKQIEALQNKAVIN